MRSTVYYLPGRGIRLETGLGEGLTNRGFDVLGRATTGKFRDLSYQEQVKHVAQDLQSKYLGEDAGVVAHSLGE